MAGRSVKLMTKGLIYGILFGMFLAFVTYLLASAIQPVVALAIDPPVMAGIMFATSVTGGVAIAYAEYIEKELG